MTKDSKLYNFCDHRVIQTLTIDGISPDYTSQLDYIANPNLNLITILDVNGVSDTQLYSMTGNGITNFYINSTGTEIVFGRYAVTPSMIYPDPNPDYTPLNNYWCAYTALKSSCPKCLGTGSTFDITYDGAGRVITLEGHDKVKQQVIKALLTQVGANTFDENYGSQLSGAIGSKIDAYLAAQLNFSVLNCINDLIDIQNTQDLPDNERIYSVSDITAVQSAEDPRKVEITVILMLADYEQISSSIIMQV